MATNDQRNEEFRLQKAHLDQRRALNNGYAALVAEQQTQTFLAFGFEEAVDLRIEAIEGEGDELRPNLLDRVSRIENEVLQAVELLKEVPPEQFLTADALRDVNTDPNQA